MTEPEQTYELQLSTDADGAPETYTFETRDGLVSKDEIRPDVLALLEHVEVGDGDDVLVVDGNYGVAGVVLARQAPGGETVVTETSARTAESCRRNAVRNEVQNVTVELTADVTSVRDGFDLAVYVPKPYEPTDLVEERLSGAVSRLVPGGTVYVAGTKTEGISRYAETLSSLADDHERLTVADGCHVHRARRPAEFEHRTFVTENEFRETVGDYTCRFVTYPGLFSADRLDDGSAALLRAVSVDDGQRVLDCCCGYGAIGAFVGARTDCELWATDDDVVATAYAERNLERNGVTPEAVTTGDCTDAVASRTFDVVLTNPPTHVGDGVTKKLFSGIRDVLASDGECYLVVNEIMNYDVRLADEFAFETAVVASEGNYDVIRARPR